MFKIFKFNKKELYDKCILANNYLPKRIYDVSLKLTSVNVNKCLDNTIKLNFVFLKDHHSGYFEGVFDKTHLRSLIQLKIQNSNKILLNEPLKNLKNNQVPLIKREVRSNNVIKLNLNKTNNRFLLRYTILSEFFLNGILTKNIRFNFLNDSITKEIELNSNWFDSWLLKYSPNNSLGKLSVNVVDGNISIFKNKVDVLQLSPIEYCKCIRDLDANLIDVLGLRRISTHLDSNFNENRLEKCAKDMELKYSNEIYSRNLHCKNFNEYKEHLKMEKEIEQEQIQMQVWEDLEKLKSIAVKEKMKSIAVKEKMLKNNIPNYWE